MRAYGFIPAKDHSTRVPGKNLRPLGGRPLVFWTIDQALLSGLSYVVVVCDGPEVTVAVAEQYEGRVRIVQRPPGMSGEVSATEVTVWAARKLHGEEEAVVQLLPTSPFRTHKHITEALTLWERDTRAAVVSVREVHAKALRYEAPGTGWLHRLRAPGADAERWPDESPPRTLVSTGGIQVASAATLRILGRFHVPKTRAVTLDAVAGLDIDTEAEWTTAVALARYAEEEMP